MSFPLFLARRFYTSRSTVGRRRSSAPAVLVATLGVAVGLAVMLVSVAVAKGFQQEVRGKVAGFGSHIEVLDMASFSSPEDFPITATPAFLDTLRGLPDVTHVQRVSQKMGILKTDEHFATVCLKGVDSEYNAAFMRSCLVEGEWPQYNDSTAASDIVISARLAAQLGLKAGSRVYAYFFETTVKMRRFTVRGIYQTNLSQYDQLFVIADLATVNRLNGWSADQCSEVEMLTADYDHIEACIPSISAALSRHTDPAKAQVAALSIKQDPRTQSTLQWIDLLDFDVAVILVLMVLVAGFTMISGLLILILERVGTIGVLKAVGATNAQLRHAFLWLAVMIIGRGLALGNAIGLGLIAVQHFWAPLRLDPSSYYVDRVPVMLSPWWWLALNVGTLALTVGALLLPSFAVSRVQPARAIRFE